MAWIIENGSYPYLDSTTRQAEPFAAPYPLSMWTCAAGSYPDCSRLAAVAALGCFANAVNLRTFRFAGTIAQWESVQRGSGWKVNAPFDSVICRDGVAAV